MRREREREREIESMGILQQNRYAIDSGRQRRGTTTTTKTILYGFMDADRRTTGTLDTFVIVDRRIEFLYLYRYNQPKKGTNRIRRINSSRHSKTNNDRNNNNNNSSEKSRLMCEYYFTEQAATHSTHRAQRERALFSLALASCARALFIHFIELFIFVF